MVENSLNENGFVWFMKCPILSENMRNISKGIKYCNYCNKHVYNVDNKKEFQQYIKNGCCVSMEGKINNDIFVPNTSTSSIIIEPVSKRKEKVNGGACIVM